MLKGLLIGLNDFIIIVMMMMMMMVLFWHGNFCLKGFYFTLVLFSCFFIFHFNKVIVFLVLMFELC